MDCSIIVSTKNRSKYLIPFLNSLNDLVSARKYEIIIVDNASDDDTSGVLASYTWSTETKITLLNEPRAGLSNGRNAGIDAAIGDVLIFIDDDCYPQPTFVDDWMVTFENINIQFAGGRILLFDSTDAAVTIQTQSYITNFDSGMFVPPGFLHGANMAIRRNALEKFGGFDVNLGAGTEAKAGEDTEIIQRICSAGGEGIYDPRPTVYHHHRRKYGTNIEELYRNYDVGRGAFFCAAILNHKWSTKFYLNLSRRVIGHLIFFRFSVMSRELRGFFIYLEKVRQVAA